MTVFCTVAFCFGLVRFAPDPGQLDAADLNPMRLLEGVTDWQSQWLPSGRGAVPRLGEAVPAAATPTAIRIPSVNLPSNGQAELPNQPPDPVKENGTPSGSVSIPYFEQREPPGQKIDLAESPAPANGRQDSARGPAAALDVPEIEIPIREEPVEPRPTPAGLGPASQPQEPQVPLVRTGKGIQTILVLGSDQRPSDPTWRTDVIMVAVINKELPKVVVVSIPRDMWVESTEPELASKINTFDYWGEQWKPGGGAELLGRVIDEQFGIPIDLYAKLRFEGFVRIVDSLGGIDIDVPCALYDIKPTENIYLNLQPGRYHFDGAQTLAYVRSRAQGGDLSRVDRQQQVLLALRSRFQVRKLVSQIPALYTTVKDAVDTNIGLLSAIQLARLAYDLDASQVEIVSLSPQRHMETGWQQGMQVWLPVWDVIRADISAALDREPGGQMGDPIVGATAAAPVCR
ncbi:MAG: LytR family transcriptional regulator [Caldilineaceae bacterium SB0664_bin_22]|nr:LytR family transcriptional regulator [Caldilineaceae bacterium SB0664_bin_22]